MNKLALGTAQFGLNYGIANTSGQISESEASRIIHTCKIAGIEKIDTAIAYGDSETRLGEIGVQWAKVITKLPKIPNNTRCVRGWIESQLSDSLTRLKLNSLYGLLLHDHNDLLGANSKVLIDSLMAAKTSGIAQKVGVSIYAPHQLEYIVDALQIDIVQAPLNVFDQRLQSSGWLSKLHSMGIEVHTRSAFLQGLLLLPRDQLPAKFERWQVLWDSWHRYIRDSGLCAASLCLRYPISLPEVSAVIVGVDCASHLSELVRIRPPSTAVVDLMNFDTPHEDLINPSRWANL
jgi:aryl-alcohol dehydrogenase-like predicted oxidoreductase